MKLTNDQFNGDYCSFCWVWVVMGLSGLAVFSIPDIVKGVSMENVSDAITFLLFFLSGFLLLNGNKTGFFLIFTGLALKSAVLYMDEGWEGFSLKIFCTFVSLIIMLAIMMFQKKNGVAAWKILFGKS